MVDVPYLFVTHIECCGLQIRISPSHFTMSIRIRNTHTPARRMN
ncbi:unnamed protein product [Acanthoscelides obtectus]|uniref:Uncharacterized protein n=1 Tax=Acanthoscelides obtectus TaxID=200917 RepID=A0A9P0KXW0_ACAOB|nr:unnamed protein product [Acanthoscelides obtectus]CAK1626301.1 hypothetical protein AOBTE_LOCUS3762 [Acanthoscelides obtectus]